MPKPVAPDEGSITVPPGPPLGLEKDRVVEDVEELDSELGGEPLLAQPSAGRLETTGRRARLEAVDATGGWRQKERAG